MPAKKPKLPKVWISIDLDSKPCFYSSGYFFTTKRAAKEWAEEGGETVHAYAPVQKPKVCVWSRSLKDSYIWVSGCQVLHDFMHKFCPSCGGKIRVRPGAGEEGE